jgi:hypothetical protein
VILEAEVAVDRLEHEPARHHPAVRPLAGRSRVRPIACMYVVYQGPAMLATPIRRRRVVSVENLHPCSCRPY